MDISLQIRAKDSDIIRIREENNLDFEIAWQKLNTLLKAKKVFWKWSTEGFEPKRDLLLSLFSNLKFIDGKIIPEWKEPFSIIAQAQLLTKQKSYTACRIPEVSSLWLREESILRTILEYASEKKSYHSRYNCGRSWREEVAMLREEKERS